MASNYWSKVLNRRIGRRRALAATGATTAGAMLLAACGGDDDDDDDDGQEATGVTDGTGGTGSSTGVLSAVVDDTADLQRGGVFQTYTAREPTSYEMHTMVVSAGIAAVCYSPLLRAREGHLEKESGEFVGEAAESWEFSPDNMQMTLRLSPDIKFVPIPPLNGRGIDAQDVLFSWDRIREISVRRGEFAAEFGEGGPIDSIEAPDDQTIVINFTRPAGTAEALMANDLPGSLLIAPKEAADESVIDFRRGTFGTGPWYVSGIEPGVSYTFKKNPGFGVDDRDIPYMDEVRHVILPEYATGIAQFRSGAIYWFEPQSEDFLPLKQEVQDLQLREYGIGNTPARRHYGMAPDSPFRDERIRQAFEMHIDRDLFLDTWYNLPALAAEGVELSRAWEGAMESGRNWEGWFLDPRDDAFGENSKYFFKDLDEARKLLAAAGHPDGIDVELYFIASGAPGAGIQTPINEILVGFIDEGQMFNYNRHNMHFFNEFKPQVQDTKGEFNGVGMGSGGLAANHPLLTAHAFYHPAGAISHGTDETLIGMIEEGLSTFDTERQKELTLELQRYEGGKLYDPRVASAGILDISWPILRNRLVWKSFSTARELNTMFIDPTRPPLNE